MIVVREVEGVKRLVCEANHTISFFNDTPDMEIEVGSIGAEVELEEGRAVDWWATYGVKVEEGASIERSYISAEHGLIEAYSVIVGSLIDCMSIIVQSKFPYDIASARNSSLRSYGCIQIMYSTVQGSTFDNGNLIVLMKSEIEQSTAVGNATFIRSTVTELDTKFRMPSTKDTSFLLEMCGTKFQEVPLTINVICATINDLAVSDSTSALAVQCSTLKECVFEGDFVIASSIFNKVNIIGDMVSSVNCILANVSVESKSPSTTMVDLRKVDERSAEECEYYIIVGDHPERVMG